MKYLGDPHNFGQRVKLIEKEGDRIVYKPRTTYWEWLFLDRESDFRKYFRKHQNCEFDNYLGHIDYGNSSLLTEGSCRFVSDVNQPIKQIPLLINFGRVLAFCTAFGITDLHPSNLVLRENMLQLLDLEVVFFDSQTPADTLLLWNRKSGNGNSMFDRILKLIHGFSSDHASMLFDSMLDEFAFIKEYSEEIRTFLDMHKSEVYKAPIRFLFRNTRDYYRSEHMSTHPMFLREENEQILRGDIPYFYGTLGESDIYYFEAPNTPKKVPYQNLRSVQQKLGRSFTVPEKLFNENAINQKLKQSLIMLASRIKMNCIFNKIESKKLRVDFDSSTIRIETKDFKVCAQMAQDA